MSKETIISESKVGNRFQTVIPAKIREELEIEQDDVLVWELDKDSRSLTVFSRRSRKDQLRTINASVFRDNTDKVE